MCATAGICVKENVPKSLRTVDVNKEIIYPLLVAAAFTIWYTVLFRGQSQNSSWRPFTQGMTMKWVVVAEYKLIGS